MTPLLSATERGHTFTFTRREDGRIGYLVTQGDWCEAGSETTLSAAAESVARVIKGRLR